MQDHSEPHEESDWGTDIRNALYQPGADGKIGNQKEDGPTDETGEYTKEYIDMLISVGRKEDIEFLNKYLRNYNHINEFIENKQQTPQVIVDAIEKARQGISAKK